MSWYKDLWDVIKDTQLGRDVIELHLLFKVLLFTKAVAIIVLLKFEPQAPILPTLYGSFLYLIIYLSLYRYVVLHNNSFAFYSSCGIFTWVAFTFIAPLTNNISSAYIIGSSPFLVFIWYFAKTLFYKDKINVEKCGIHNIKILKTFPLYILGLLMLYVFIAELAITIHHIHKIAYQKIETTKPHNFPQTEPHLQK